MPFLRFELAAVNATFDIDQTRNIMIKTTNIFCSFSVKDLNTSEIFYAQVLGLKTKKDWMGLHVYLADDQEVFLYAKNEDHSPASFTVLNLVVEHIDQAVAHLLSHNISLEKYDGMPQDDDGVMRATSPEDGPSICWFKDPSGNVISLIEATDK